MNGLYLLLSIGFSFALAFGQLLFKLSAQSLAAASGSFIERMLFSPLLWFTFGWYGATSVLWVFILMRVPLSQAYPFALLGAAVVPVVAAVVFKEPLGTRYWLGTALILLGLFLAVGQPPGTTMATPHDADVQGPGGSPSA